MPYNPEHEAIIGGVLTPGPLNQVQLAPRLLSDYFAAAALRGLMRREWDDHREEIAAIAFRYADAMLAVRFARLQQARKSPLQGEQDKN